MTKPNADGSTDGKGTGDRFGERSATTRRSVIKTVGAGALAAGFGSSAIGTGAAITIPTPTLHTEGRWTRDPSGNNVRLRGVSPASLDFITRSWYPKSWEEILGWATDGDRGWHPTVVRIPCEYGGVNHHGGIETFVSDYLRPAVDYLATRDVYAMIDFHVIRPYTQQATEEYNADQDSEADQLDPVDDVVRDFWSTVAPEFAEDSHVIYEIFNEPTYPNTWGSYGENVSTRRESWELWRENAQPWVDMVQQHAPERPVVIGSPDWTSETQFAPEMPFSGDNLIYASHIYPDNGTPSTFDDEYGAPAEEVPCFLTEFGWDPGVEEDELHYGTNDGWGQPVREWVEGYDNYHWTAWCFDDTWAPTFFESPADNPTEGVNEPWGIKPEGEFVKAWLADTRDLQNPSTGDGPELPPVGDNENRPTDPDGDGLYEDVNGNGGGDLADAVDLYQNRQSAAVQDNVDAYDFSGNDSIDLADVVELYQENLD